MSSQICAWLCREEWRTVGRTGRLSNGRCWSPGACSPGHGAIFSRQRKGRATRFLPIGDQMIAEESPPDIACDRRHNHFLPPPLVRAGAEDDGGAQFPSGFIRKHETYQYDVASIKGGHTRRPSGCPTGQPGPGPISPSEPTRPGIHHPGPAEVALQSFPRCTAGP